MRPRCVRTGELCISSTTREVYSRLNLNQAPDNKQLESIRPIIWSPDAISGSIVQSWKKIQYSYWTTIDFYWASLTTHELPQWVLYYLCALLLTYKSAMKGAESARLTTVYFFTVRTLVGGSYMLWAQFQNIDSRPWDLIHNGPPKRLLIWVYFKSRNSELIPYMHIVPQPIIESPPRGQVIEGYKRG